MKKVLLLSMMAGIALASCSDNGDEPVTTVTPPPSLETTPTQLVIPDSQQSGATAGNGHPHRQPQVNTSSRVVPGTQAATVAALNTLMTAETAPRVMLTLVSA